MSWSARLRLGLGGLLGVGWLCLAGWPLGLQANGGTLRLNDVPVGPYRMAVFTDPTPMRPDSVDVSVLILDPQSGEVVDGLTVEVETTDGVTSVTRPATRDQADDPERYYAAKFTLPNPGDWTFAVTVRIPTAESADIEATGSFTVTVKEAGFLDNPFVLTSLLLLPLIALAVWMLRGTQRASTAILALPLLFGLAVQAGCVPPDRTPPYEDLTRLFELEDARSAEPPAELLEATNVQNPSLRAAAYRGLGRHERSDWIPVIADGMRDPDPEVRVVAINAVAQAAHKDEPGFAGKRAALDRFTAALGGERHPRVRAAIALAAGRLAKDPTLADLAERVILEVSTEPGEAALFDARSIGNPGAPLLDLVRGSFALARASGGSHPSRDELTVLLAELTGFGRDTRTATVLDPTEPSLTAARIRRTSLATLLATGQLSEPVVLEASRDADPGVRATLAAALGGRVELPRRDEVMRAFAEDPAPQVRTRWVSAYSSGDRPQGCAPLIDAARSTEPQVVLAALDALGGTCPAEADAERLALLRDVASDAATRTDWHAPARAIVALARLDADDAPAHAEALEANANPFARAWAARAYSVLGRADGLRRLLADPAANVRTVALGGVARVLGAQATPLIVDQLEADDPQLIMTAAGLLEGVGADPEISDALFAAFSRFTAGGRDTDRDARMALLDRLAEIASPQDSTRLNAYVEDYDAAVAERVAQQLSTWTGRAIAPTPRPFDGGLLPSPEELRSLDGAHVELRMESGGTIRFELFPLIAPTNAARVARLAESGGLDGLTFHRVVPGFVVQGGSPGANEYAGHGPFSRDEITDQAHWRGTVGLSTRGRDTGDGQIFVNLLDNLRLDNDYTIYGRVVAGMDVVDALLEGARIEEATLVTAPGSD